MRLDPVHLSMLVIGVSFACYAPSLNSLQDQAYRSAVVIEGEVRSSPENVSASEPYSVNVRVLDVWPVNSGGLEREQLVTVGDFGSEAPCTTVEKDHRYIFFMDPTAEPLVFKASYAPVDASEPELKKNVERVLCEDCASAPKLRPMRGQSLLEGGKMYLKCEASGNPSPSFRWYKDGRELQKGRDLKIKTNVKNSKLQITRVRLEDSGNYTCVAENTLGQENATSIITVQILTTTTPSPGVSHVRRCNDSERAYCANGGDCYFIHGFNQLSCKCPNDYTGDRCQNSVLTSFYKMRSINYSNLFKNGFMEAEEVYQRRVLTITGICVALLVVGIVCVVAYCKTKKQRNQMQRHLHQNQNQFVEQPNRVLANGPNHPGPGPEEIPMLDYIPKSVPTTECVISHGAEGAGNYAGSRMSTRSHHSTTASHASRHEEQTWSMERTESVNSDCQSGGLSSSVGTSKCSSPACMARRAANYGCTDVSGMGMQYGDSYDSLRDSPHSDRYVSALTTPARLSPVEFHYPPLPPQVPTFQITSPNTSHALSLPPAAAAYHRDDDQPLLRCPEDGSLYRQPRRPRRPYLTESTGSLPSSPYHLPDDEAYETTQEYASSREPIRSRRRPRRNRLNGHTSQRSAGFRDYSSQSFSQSEEEEEEDEDEDAHGESTPFLSMQNMNMDQPLTGSGYRSSSGADTRTHRGLSRPSARSNGQSRSSQSQRSKADNMPL
ncbi:neuregulin 2b isoform X1 [Poecilia latipinna]|uniref:pro-neuregulin-2, membrane-bound isoform-like isoform X1 n=1 Tax=Poecilia mexicana TaxID=48701 RepID=UPI00072E072A|nr:PREDICTED: pro-neuregulin-2, membrane-bound isoform-like isoform X1 [Poecilia mexicana]XP_014895974.1 PREDICTED: pro-neuregulin-2, membrane-bound isoform isoform X1 [Poecilia latipinna]XP_016535292.1 PREDICTED: pro-neuregulin-2, membrane-bound isoform-like isoform X1 [Poecilia formosa]